MPQTAVRELTEHSTLLHAPVISDPSEEAARGLGATAWPHAAEELLARH